MPDPRFPDPKLPENKATDIPPGPPRAPEPARSAPAPTAAPAPAPTAARPATAAPAPAAAVTPTAAITATPPPAKPGEKHYRTLGHVGAFASGSVVPRSSFGSDADLDRLLGLGVIVEEVPERPK